MAFQYILVWGNMLNNNELKLIKTIISIRKSFNKDISIHIIYSNNKYIISNVETLEAIKLKERLFYEPSDIDEYEYNSNAFERGII